MKFMKSFKKVITLVIAVAMVVGGCAKEPLNEEHTHSYSDATCTRGEMCECGEEIGTALGHELVDGCCVVCGETPEYDVGNFIILGDSISTFEGSIPSLNLSFYPTDYVNRVEQTWWSIFADNTKATLLLNESYSGSTICYTGYNGASAASTSFIRRFENLKMKDFFDDNVVDTIIIFGGTNDSWANVPLGEVMYSDWKPKDLYSFLPAFCYLIDSIQTELPETKIVCIINQGLSALIRFGMKQVCEEYGVSYVELKKIEEQGSHPTVEGMIQIEKQIRRVFEEEKH